MKRLQRGLLTLMVLVWAVPSSAQTFSVPNEFWLTPRSGQVVRTEPSLQQAFAAYIQSDRTHLRLHHQKRDESIAQAEELRSWLLVLGIEAGRIEMVDNNPLNTLKLEIVDIQ